MLEFRRTKGAVTRVVLKSFTQFASLSKVYCLLVFSCPFFTLEVEEDDLGSFINACTLPTPLLLPLSSNAALTNSFLFLSQAKI